MDPNNHETNQIAPAMQSAAGGKKKVSNFQGLSNMPFKFKKLKGNVKAAHREYIKCLGRYVPILFEDVAENLQSFSHLAKARKHAAKRMDTIKGTLTPVADACNLGPTKTGSTFAPTFTDLVKFKKQAKTYFSSKLCLQAAMLEANGRRLLRNRVSPYQLIQLSHQYDVLKDLDETVTVHKVQKSDGSGFRHLQDFGPVARGAQLMVVNLLALTYARRPFQYADHGSSQKAEMALNLIRNEGYVWLGEIDIIKFFQSYELNQLVEALPLPKEAVTQIVAACAAVRVYPSGTMYPPLSPKARPGIPQGGVASNEVAAWSVAHLPMPDLDDVVLINHVDNFYLLAKDFKSLEAASKALRAAIPGCPGGPFEGKVKQLTTIDDGYCMLGCWMFREDDNVIAMPTDANLKKFRLRFSREYQHAVAKLNIAQATKNAEARFDGVLVFVQLNAFVTAWFEAFKFCEDHFMETIRTDRQWYIDKLQSGFGISEQEAKEARRYISAVHLDTYGY